MKGFITGLSILISMTAFPKEVELDLQAKWKKNNTTRFQRIKVIAELGKEFIVPIKDINSMKFVMTPSQDASKIQKINPKVTNDEVVLLEGTIYTLQDGQEKKVGNPHILTLLGKKATFSTRTEEGEYFELSVLPSKTQL